MSRTCQSYAYNCSQLVFSDLSLEGLYEWLTISYYNYSKLKTIPGTLSLSPIYRDDIHISYILKPTVIDFRNAVPFWFSYSNTLYVIVIKPCYEIIHHFKGKEAICWKTAMWKSLTILGEGETKQTTELLYFYEHSKFSLDLQFFSFSKTLNTMLNVHLVFKHLIATKYKTVKQSQLLF